MWRGRKLTGEREKAVESCAEVMAGGSGLAPLITVGSRICFTFELEFELELLFIYNPF